MMFERFRRRFRAGRRERCCCTDTSAECIPLALGQVGNKYVIFRNSDAKTREMGLYPGAEVHVIKNTRGDTGIVVAVGEARYAVHRDIAGLIIVRPGT
ncbi:MAG TPA: FeoA domain-containing protein [Phycisphaerae bacterium]|nr:FeoA domain-containing protein [Phycisphaerae bacterium]HPS52044.1 FeoA domain-containing protein [Phycisphaerae bacterium]